MGILKIQNKIRIKDWFLLFLTIFLPFGFYFYNFFPVGVKYMYFLSFEIEAIFYEDLNEFFWFLSVKLLTLSLISIWFLTCEEWWKWILFVPILTEINKIVYHVFFFNVGSDVYWTNYISLKYALVYSIILISIKHFSEYQNKIDHKEIIEINKEINNELNKLTNFNVNNYKKVKQSFKEIKSKNIKENKIEYLARLIALRDKLNDI